jgi:hypothetical protein
MHAATLLDSHQSQGRPTGCWMLAAGRALSLRPREAGVLRIAGGAAWITFDGPHDGPANDQGDLLLAPGESLRVAAGRRLVLETHGTEAVAFQWDFAPQPQPQPVPLAQDWAALRQAIGLALGAGGRLAAGLARLAWHGLRSGGPRAHPAA